MSKTIKVYLRAQREVLFFLFSYEVTGIDNFFSSSLWDFRECFFIFCKHSFAPVLSPGLLWVSVSQICCCSTLWLMNCFNQDLLVLLSMWLMWRCVCVCVSLLDGEMWMNSFPDAFCCVQQFDYDWDVVCLLSRHYQQFCSTQTGHRLSTPLWNTNILQSKSRAF